MGDVLAIGALFAGVIGFFAAVILGAMRFEAWRQRRAAASLARGLEGGRLANAPGPGAWSLGGVAGRRAGCEVALAPRALRQSITLDGPTGGRTRLQAMGVELVVRGSRAVGRGALRAHRGELHLEGELMAPDPATRRALIDCRAELTLEGREARAEYALPLSKRTIAEMLSLIDALGRYFAMRPAEAAGETPDAQKAARAALLQVLRARADAAPRLHEARVQTPAAPLNPMPTARANSESAHALHRSTQPMPLTRGRPPLHRAVECQDVEEVEAMLTTGTDPNALDEHGRPPLAYALPWAIGFQLSPASERIIKALLAAGADIACKDVGRTLVAEADAMVCSAAEAGDAGRLETLLGLR